MDTFFLYFWYFLIFGFLGWIFEVVYAACVEGRFVNRGFLNGPYCPIYGFGVALVSLCLNSFSDNILLLFLGSVLLTTILEFITGFILERFFHTKWWDYSGVKFNFMGYICLGFSLIWGLACTIVVSSILPFLKDILELIPHNVSLIAAIIFGTILLVDFVITIFALAGLNHQIRKLGEISDKMLAISDKLGKLIADGTIITEKKIKLSEEEIEVKKQDLHKKYVELTEKYQKTLSHTDIIKRRVLNAFPDLRLKKYQAQHDQVQIVFKNFAEVAKEFVDEFEEKRQLLVLETYEDRLPKNQEKPFGYGLCFNKIFILFMIGNVVGSVLETIFCLIVDGKFEMRVGLVYGPFIPVYGIGAVLITLCLYKFYKARDLWLFLGSMVIGASFEYFSSYFQEKLLGTVSWDYTGTFLNIDGRTNLMYGLFWGILGLVWVKDLYPVISKTIERIPKKIGNVVSAVLVVFMIYNIFISCAAVIRQNDRAENVPAKTQLGEYLDEYFPDEYMEFIYPHMQNAKTGVQNQDKNKEESIPNK